MFSLFSHFLDSLFLFIFTFEFRGVFPSTKWILKNTKINYSQYTVVTVMTDLSVVYVAFWVL